jgi:hypothetical protein
MTPDLKALLFAVLLSTIVHISAKLSDNNVNHANKYAYE